MNKLRPLVEIDSQQLFIWRNMPEVSANMYNDHKISQEEHLRWFSHAIKDESRKYWIIQCDGRDVGLVNIYGIDKVNHRCQWAFYIAEMNLRGKGVGSYVEYSILDFVFTELELNKLGCEVFVFNEPVRRMHQKFGFKEEGVLRQHIFKAGKFQDVSVLGILQHEWLDARPRLSKDLTEKGILR